MMRKRLALAGFVSVFMGIGGWILFLRFPNLDLRLSPQTGIDWFFSFPFVTIGALSLVILGIAVIVLSLVLG